MTQLEIANLALQRLGEAVITAFDTTTAAGAAAVRYWEPVRDEMLRRHRWNFARTRAFLEPTWVTATSVADNGGEVQMTKASHGLSTGNRVTLRNFNVAGSFRITVDDVNNFTLDDSTYNSGIVAGDYTVAPAFGYAYRIALPSGCMRVLEVNGIEATAAEADYEVEAGSYLVTDVDEANLIYTAQITDQTKWDSLFIAAFIVKLASRICVAIKGSQSTAAELLQEYERLLLPDAVWADAIEPRSKIRAQDSGSRSVSARLYGEL